MKSSTLATIAAILGGILLLVDVPTPTPVKPTPVDALLGCYVADRQSKIEILTEMAGMEFRDDQERCDWWNSEIDAARTEDMQPFVDLLAEAIEAGKLLEFAEGLK